MSRFPFEEDRRFRFGSFYELVARYMFIGSEPETGPAPVRTTPPRPRPVRPATQCLIKAMFVSINVYIIERSYYFVSRF